MDGCGIKRAREPWVKEFRAQEAIRFNFSCSLGYHSAVAQRLIVDSPVLLLSIARRDGEAHTLAQAIYWNVDVDSANGQRRR